MNKSYKDDLPITAKKFMEELRRYQNGSVSRRHFLGVTGLGTAMAVLGSAVPGLAPRNAYAAGDIGDRVILATWPNYHDPKNFEKFTEMTGAHVQVNVFGSNEEMLAKLQAGGSGWDVFVPTNYTITTYVSEDLIEPIDTSLLPHYDASAFETRFSEAGSVNGTLYAVPKNWGHTGFVYDSDKAKAMTSWKEFFDLAKTDHDGRTIVHDYQLTTIGAACNALGYSFNSIDPEELANAEKLLIEVKPHIFAITSDYQPPLRAGDAWVSICWSGDGIQLSRDIPSMKYKLGKEGGELWSDYYAVPKGAPHREAAYALIDFLTNPENNVNEVHAHGYATADVRTKKMLPEAMLNDPVMYPAEEALSPLEFGAAATLTDPLRAEIIARFKSA